jgi:hypothetical protein
MNGICHSKNQKTRAIQALTQRDYLPQLFISLQNNARKASCFSISNYFLFGHSDLSKKWNVLLITFGLAFTISILSF